MAQTIEIVIENGKAQVTTRGFQGKACLDATADLERAMGVKTADQKTPEFDVRSVQSRGA